MTTHPSTCPGCYGSDRHPTCSYPHPRGAEGRRHSADDQQHLDEAAGHLVQAGANLPDDVDEDDAPTLTANSTFAERYKAELTRRFATMRAATRAIKADITASPAPRMRTLEECVPPDGYRAAMANRAPTLRDLECDMSPGYDPFGVAPDGYRLAMALRQLRKEHAAERTATARSASRATTAPPIMHSSGVVDSYATAVAARRRS